MCYICQNPSHNPLNNTTQKYRTMQKRNWRYSRQTSHLIPKTDFSMECWNDGKLRKVTIKAGQKLAASTPVCFLGSGKVGAKTRYYCIHIHDEARGGNRHYSTDRKTIKRLRENSVLTSDFVFHE